VVVSIQSQLLVTHPFLNEPGYEGHAPDSPLSLEYNATLRLHTMRHAMTAQLRSPPCGFEELVQAHFAAQRARILHQCWGWTEEAPLDLRPKMLAALQQLHDALPPPTVPNDAAALTAKVADGGSTVVPTPSAHGGSPSGVGASTEGGFVYDMRRDLTVESAGACADDEALYD